MLKSERHQFILDLVKKDGKVLVNHLTEILGVTEDTIRKDLQELSKKGLVRRVHGGALNINHEIIDFEQRVSQYSERKRNIALKAIEFLDNKKVIFIDSGSTNLSFAEQIPQHFEGLVITNSPVIALSLCNHPKITIQLLPGELEKVSKVLKGSSTIKAIEDINIELCILGVSSIDCIKGISVPSYDESIIKKQLIIQSSETIALITKEKFDTSSTFYVDETNKLKSIITENGVNSNTIKKYKELGIQVITT
ncbi:DeoR/GlpR family DNA-binding transcription regulator [Enterococcus olivae]